MGVPYLRGKSILMVGGNLRVQIGTRPSPNPFRRNWIGAPYPIGVGTLVSGCHFGERSGNGMLLLPERTEHLRIYVILHNRHAGPILRNIVPVCGPGSLFNGQNTTS